ncbi:type I restriction endonuclease EcoR124II [Synergistales bacterium]|nr:type I restriction endonuclease EcoR124II [Synergistales bacterium]
MNTKQLRQKILDLAIRGKLVPQDPNDESAAVLLERIRAEKEQLIKAGKIKRDKGDSAILRGDDKSHYAQLPQKWVWCKLGDIVELFSGQDLTPERYNDSGIGIPYITGASCLENGRVIVNRWTDSPQVYSQCDDLLLTCKGAGIGKMAISHLESAHIARQIQALRAYTDISIHYLQYVISSNIQIIISQANGLIPGIRREIILDFAIPLPPIAEQRRITVAIESTFAVINEIERNKSNLQAAVTAAKSKILSLAIRGKLVPQDPADEPASVLLDRIRAERESLVKQGKIKLAKSDSVIFRGDDNSYYVGLAESWAVCQLCEILDYEQPTQYIVNTTDYRDEYKTPVLTAGKSFIIGYTQEQTGICSDLPVIIFDDFTTDSRYVDFPFKVKSSAMKILRTNWVDIKYLNHFMKTVECNHTTHKRYWISDYSQKYVALPPLAEQQRIVAAIEVAFEQLDSITATLV